MNKPKSDWLVFDVDELRSYVAENEPRFHEFLRVPSMSLAMYRLPAGSKDMQSPHLEDEVYAVLEGRARLKIDGQVTEITPGKILYVRANTDHSFFDIEEDLVLIAMFGPQ